ncbi:flavodoxin [Coriobacteriales bacterium OH1046]|nr:flavodoxin [Coriobacteriales bacterium OH1046]
MKTLIIYTSQTGFTKKYAGWIAGRMKADLIELKDARKKDAAFFDEYQAIAYGGWAIAGKVAKVKWFLDKAADWRGKRLAVFCVGASPNESPVIEEALHNMLSVEQRAYIRAFYCQGGLNYEKMKLPSKLAMKMFASIMKRKKKVTEDEKNMAEMISASYDISDFEYIEPIVLYLENEG